MGRQKDNNSYPLSDNKTERDNRKKKKTAKIMKIRQTGRQKTVELEERTTKYQDTRGQHDRKTGHQKYKKTGGQGDSKNKGLEERISAYQLLRSSYTD